MDISKIEVKNKKEEPIMVDMAKLIAIDPSVEPLLKFPLHRCLISLEVHGAPPEISNALVRASTTEQEGLSLEMRDENVKTNDPYINVPRLVDNMKFIPIVYGLKDEVIKSLTLFMDIHNASQEIRPITFGDLQYSMKLGHPLSYPSTVLTYLQPGMRLQIDHISIIRGNGFAPSTSRETARFFPAHAYSLVPLDREANPKPRFSYGDEVATSCPMKHRIRCEIGAMVPGSTGILDVMFYKGCLSILVRLGYLAHAVETRDPASYEEVKGRVVLSLPETNTIAKMLDRVAFILYPDIGAITSESRYPDDILVVIVEDSRARDILIETIRTCSKIFERLLAAFSG